MGTFQGQYNGAAYDFAQQIVTTSAAGVDSTKRAPSGQVAAQAIEVYSETEPIRVRYDGTAPTAAIGTLVGAGSVFTINGEANVRQAKFIRDASAAGDATLNVTFLR